MIGETRAFAARRERHENAAARAARTPSRKQEAAPVTTVETPEIDRFTRAGLIHYRRVLHTAWEWALIRERPETEALEAALTAIDNECIAAGIESLFTADGLAVLE
jgi:hypothetical protein